MNFNPDPNKQAQEVIFSRLINKTNHPPFFLTKTESYHVPLKNISEWY